MIWRPVGARATASAPSRSLSPAWARQGARGRRGDTPVWRKSLSASAGRNVGTADDTGRYNGGYYDYGQAGAGYGYAGAGPTDSGGQAPPGAAAAPDGDAAAAAAWPGVAGYDDGPASANGSGWQQQPGDGQGSGWADAAEWGAYEAPGEWGARGQTYVAADGPAAAWDPSATAAAAGSPGASAADEQAWRTAAAEGAAPGAGPSDYGGPGTYGAFDQDSFRGPWGANNGAPPPPPPGAGGGWAGAAAAGAAGAAAGFGGGGGAGPAAGQPPPLLPSDITLITPRDAELVLPVLPTNDQARHYQPKSVPERVVQVLGSIGVSAALSKSALLAGPALLYPIWGPWIRAGARNAELYLRQFRSLGLWRAQVLSVEVQVMPYAYMRAAASGAPYSPADSVSVTVGDPWPGGARAQLRFPYVPGCEVLVAGESAEMLVLCRDAAFTSFKVVREVYFPQSGLWLADYPFVNRDVFLDISLAVERGRQMAADGNGGGGGGGFGASSSAGFGSPFSPGFGAAAAPPPPPPGAAAWGGAAYDVDAAPVGDFGGDGMAQEQQQRNGGGGDVLYASYRPVEAPSGDDEPSVGAAGAAAEAGYGYDGSSSGGSSSSASSSGYGAPSWGASSGGVGGAYDAPPDGAAGAAAAAGYWINEEGYAVPWDEAPNRSSGSGSAGPSAAEGPSSNGGTPNGGVEQGWPPAGAGYNSSSSSQPGGDAGRWAAASGPQQQSAAGWQSSGAGWPS